ncbi:MAG: Oxidoreductase, FAD-binding, partial [uncultured Acetobacteraceae bacterium]
GKHRIGEGRGLGRGARPRWDRGSRGWPGRRSAAPRGRRLRGRPPALERHGGQAARRHRALRHARGRAPGAALRPWRRAGGRGARRRPQHRRRLLLRRRPDGRPFAHEGRPGGSRAPDRARGARRAPRRVRRGDPGARAGHDHGREQRHRHRRSDARRRPRPAGPERRPGLRQPPRGGGGAGGRALGAGERGGEPGPALGPAGRRRQLRDRHRLRVPAAPARADGARRDAALGLVRGPGCHAPLRRVLRRRPGRGGRPGRPAHRPGRRADVRRLRILRRAGRAWRTRAAAAARGRSPPGAGPRRAGRLHRAAGLGRRSLPPGQAVPLEVAFPARPRRRGDRRPAGPLRARAVADVGAGPAAGRRRHRARAHGRDRLREPGRGLRLHPDRDLGGPGAGRGERRLVARGVGGDAALRDRRRLREQPGRGGGGAHPRRLRRELRPARRAQGEVRPDEPLPAQPEHQAGRV